VLSSVQSEKTLQGDTRALLPREYTAANFRLILSAGAERGPIFQHVSYLPKSVERFPDAFLNSLVVGVAVSALARRPVRGTHTLPQMSAISRMVPLIVLMVPLYVLFRTYGLLNSLSGVILAEVGFLIPYAIMILVPYFASFPGELEDAARIDGC